MKGDTLPPDHHFSRYGSPGTIDDDLPNSGAFKPREVDGHLSINWLEYFDGLAIEQAVDAVREALIADEFDIRRNGRFLVLEVTRARNAILDGTGKSVSILHWPDDTVENWPDDDLNPSHSGIFGYEASDVEVALELSQLISEDAVYPALI